MGEPFQVEVESKFDADADVRIDGLDRIPGIAGALTPVDHDLDAEYLDTADLRLLQAGIALRRRTGGDDAGWHLKIERAPGERIEVHRPLGRAGGPVPKPLRDLVLLHVRDRGIEPVAQLHTRRRVHRVLGATGDVVAEVADDHVTATTIGGTRAWREVEVELVGTDDRQLLAAIATHLHDAGVRPPTASSKLARALAGALPTPAEPGAVGRSSTAGEVVAAYLRDQVQALVDADPAVRLDAEDAVHKMRVAVRRLRSALATYRRLLDTDVTEPLRDELTWLGGVLGPARDAEVIRDQLRHEVAEEPAHLVVGPVRRRIDRSLVAEHRAAHRQAVVDLSSPRYFALVDALEGLPGAVQGRRAARPARKVLAAEVGRAHRRLRRRLEVATAGPDAADEELHEVRKAAKRVRYAAESVRAVFGAKATRLAGRMEEAQELLGAHQDSVVVRGVIRRLADEAAGAGESAFTYGRLDARAEQRAADSAAEFLAHVDDGWAEPPGWLG